MDQASSFMSHQVREFAESLKIKLLSSSSYYPQANGEAKSSNKTLIKLIKKKIEEHPTGGMKSCQRLYGHITSPSIA
jgi:transposase InsO family protein